MKVEIITNPLELHLHGLSGIAQNKDYVATAFKLSGKMWEIVKANGIKNKGKNIWIYEKDDNIFSGVELEGTPSLNPGLEHRRLSLPKYAYFKHVGPYNLIKQAGLSMRHELTSNGFKIDMPYIEIYGHWTNDETKCETELLMSLR